jgi:hypothetical protein
MLGALDQIAGTLQDMRDEKSATTLLIQHQNSKIDNHKGWIVNLEQAVPC